MDITNKTENKANLNNRELRYNIDDKRSNEEKEGIMIDDEALEKVSGGVGDIIRVTPAIIPY